MEDIEQIKERQKLSWEGMFYSTRRIDLLIISICGAGIYICLETVKYISNKCQDVSVLIKISGGFFLFGIMVNFISQLYGQKTNEQDYLMCQAKIDAGKKISKKEEEEIDTYDEKSEGYSKWTERLNYLSIILMFLGLLTIMCYFFFIF